MFKYTSREAIQWYLRTLNIPPLMPGDTEFLYWLESAPLRFPEYRSLTKAAVAVETPSSDIKKYRCT
jgi:hypothetical protein